MDGVAQKTKVNDDDFACVARFLVERSQASRHQSKSS
jgi:hypothetical protein